ncbi:hypothetical protein [Cupriavidus basilensis]|uniref:hypothetical protein n=1 Tax=Cupriavidus basilensis TaxID=68895 RepID=UPI0039F69BE2
MTEQVTPYLDTCTTCKGTGKFQAFGRQTVKLPHCKDCNGTGQRYYKQSREQRAKRSAAIKEREEAGKRAEVEWMEAQKQSAFRTFEAAHPDIAQWWTSSPLKSAATLRGEATAHGNLTEAQVQMARRCIENEAAMILKAEGSHRRIDVDAWHIADRLQREPVAQVGSFTFRSADDTSQNPGAIYAIHTETDQYLGKIVLERIFLPLVVSDYPNELLAELVDLLT